MVLHRRRTAGRTEALPTREDLCRRIGWIGLSEASPDPSRTRARSRRRRWRAIEHGTAEPRPEPEEEREGETIEQKKKLGDFRRPRRPLEIHPRAQPAQGTADQTALDEMAPASERPFGDRLLALPRIAGPSEGRTDPIASRTRHRLEHRAHRRPAPPEFGRGQRCGRPGAEDDPNDREVLEHHAPRKVDHPLPAPNRMSPRALPRPAVRAANSGHPNQKVQIVGPALDHPPVVTKLGSEYTLDWHSRVAGSAVNLLLPPHASVAGWAVCNLLAHIA